MDKKDAQLGRGLVSDDETAHIAWRVDKGSRLKASDAISRKRRGLRAGKRKGKRKTSLFPRQIIDFAPAPAFT